MNEELPCIARARAFGNRPALVDGSSRTRYADLVAASGRIAACLLGPREDLDGARVAFLAPAGPSYVATLWGIWRAGGIALPLSLTASEPELRYVLEDAGVSTVVCVPDYRETMADLCRSLELPLLEPDDGTRDPGRACPEVDASRDAMILYTSGTTSKPKGVVTTHATIRAQVESLVEAWQWKESDCIPLFLPLHHIHGIINILSCALWSGAVVETFPRFDRPTIFERVGERAYTVFMAVPTIYVKMIEGLKALPDEERRRILDGFASMRLMVSGSAALPATVHEAWADLTGQVLLERYGMTEIGMALSNPYTGERRPGAVGRPLPGVDIRLVDEQGNLVAGEGTPGEIQVRGPTVFRAYWNRPDISADAFTDGWFRTGDMAVREDGYYRILGRSSVDIIKSGGYKLSALEIETKLLEHPGIRACAVVGLPDNTWGESVAVAFEPGDDAPATLDDLRDWCRERMSAYKIPRRLLQVDQLPRNAMGKVTKPAVVRLFS